MKHRVDSGQQGLQPLPVPDVDLVERNLPANFRQVRLTSRQQVVHDRYGTLRQ